MCTWKEGSIDVVTAFNARLRGKQDTVRICADVVQVPIFRQIERFQGGRQMKLLRRECCDKLYNIHKDPR